MYEHWTDEQRAQATGRWVSTEHEGAPPDTSRVQVHVREFGDPDSYHTAGYYNAHHDAWYVMGWVGTKAFNGYKGVAYWRCLPGRED